MTKSNNKGVSFIEIVIAITVFVIFAIPILADLATGSKMGTSSKDLQYVNEYAKELMEYVKQTDDLNQIIADVDAIPLLDNATWTDENGTVDINETDASGNVVTNSYNYTGGLVEGTLELGTQHEKYNYIMQISSEPYLKGKDKEGKDSLNQANLGKIEDLDHNKVAYIPGTLSNYDRNVTDAFFSKKLEITRSHAPETWNQIMLDVDEENIFQYDKATRVIKIIISGNKNDGYKVQCWPTYTDLSDVVLDDGYDFATAGELAPRTEMPYGHSYPKDTELPSIYLMYNPFMYNGYYMETDYIVIDNSGVTDDAKINVFVLETATHYAEDVAKVYDKMENIVNDAESKAGKYLVPKDTGVNRKNIVTYLYTTNTSKPENMTIYHNFDDETHTDAGGTIYDKKSEINYTTAPKAPLTSDQITEFKELTSSDLEKSAVIKLLSEAERKEDRLFEVKIWLKKDSLSAIDITKDKPTLVGTKGGK